MRGNLIMKEILKRLRISMKKHSYSLPYKDFIQAELITDFRVNKLPFYVEVNE